MSSDIAWIDTYACPQCRTELETRFHEWQGWQRCPKCGLPALPPEPVAPIGEQRGAAVATAGRGMLVAADLPEKFADPDLGAATAPGRSSYVSGARLILRTGLLVSLVLAFIFFLDRRTTNTVIFAFLAFVFFVLLLRTPVRPGPTS